MKKLLFVISMIIFCNCIKGQTALTSDSSYIKGTLDADKNYKGKNSGKGGTYETALFLGPLIGLVPAILCSQSDPKEKNLNIQDKSLENNQYYMAGYTKEAHHIKSKKVWVDYALGSVADIVLITVFAELNN